MDSTLIGVRGRDDVSGSTSPTGALARPAGAIERDLRVASATRRVRRELGQAEHFTDERGVRLPVRAMSHAEAQAVLWRLRANAARLHRGELGAYLLRRYPHPTAQAVLDEYLSHVAAIGPVEWLESRPLYRALTERAMPTRADDEGRA
jgi:hypothetical protein